MDMNNTIVAVSMLYGHPAVLFKHDKGYAFKYKGEVEDVGTKYKFNVEVTEEIALKKFKWNFGEKVYLK